MKYQADVLILTTAKVETIAVLAAARKLTKRNPIVRSLHHKVYHNLGAISGANVWLVQSEMGSGGLGAAQQTVSKAIAALSPNAVIMVGIAFGLDPKKQTIGGVLVSKHLMLYEMQRAGTRGGRLNLISRGDRPHASVWLVDRFRNAELSWTDSPVQFGLVLTGEKLVDNLALRAQLRALEPEAIGGEMEAGGVYVGCQDAKVDWILVKAICDWADGRKGLNKTERQKLAARNAASFVLHTLQITPLVTKRSQRKARRVSQTRPPSAAGVSKRTMTNASSGIGSKAVIAAGGGVAVGGSVHGGVHISDPRSSRSKRSIL